MAPYQKTNASCRSLSCVSFKKKGNALDQMVGLGRLELPTSRLSSARSNQLSYKPLTLFLKEDQDKARAQSVWPMHRTALKPSGSVFVREERETKTAKSRQWSSTIPRLPAPECFYNDPIDRSELI